MKHAAQPAFAEAWMRQWRAAGPALERVRAEELRALDAAASNRAGSVFATSSAAKNYSGLIDQQAWFMRQRLLLLTRPSGSP